jgi:hypothetical protein
VVRSNEKPCVCNVFATPHSKNPVKSSIPSYKNVNFSSARDNSIEYQKRANFPENIEFSGIFFILMSMVLAVGRAMGETMAVMMVMGNANLFPKLLGKSESIASVIALEMGTVVYGSPHYHALYAAGMVLMVILFVINLGIHLLAK